MPNSRYDSIYISSDNLLTIANLTNRETGAPVTDATVTVTLKDSAGNDVTGQSWPASATYSSGAYYAVLDDTLSLTAGALYTAHIDAVKSGLKKHWQITFYAEVDTVG